MCVHGLPLFRTASKYAGMKNGWRKRLSCPSWSDYGTFRGVAPASRNEGSYHQEYRNVKSLLHYFMDEAPRPIRDLAIKLSEIAGKPVNYFSLVGYADGRDHIDWHQHSEDRGRDARVFIVSLGETRTFGKREICPECRVCATCNQSACDGVKRHCKDCKAAWKHRKTCAVLKDNQRWLLFEPAHGSLITLTSEENFTHEHAVLVDGKSNGLKGLRLSFNTKCLPVEQTLNDYILRMQGDPVPSGGDNEQARRAMATDLNNADTRPENQPAADLSIELLTQFFPESNALKGIKAQWPRQK
jgi:hypothetical protein